MKHRHHSKLLLFLFLFAIPFWITAQVTPRPAKTKRSHSKTTTNKTKKASIVGQWVISDSINGAKLSPTNIFFIEDTEDYHTPIQMKLPSLAEGVMREYVFIFNADNTGKWYTEPLTSHQIKYTEDNVTKTITLTKMQGDVVDTSENGFEHTIPYQFDQDGNLLFVFNKNVLFQDKNHRSMDAIKLIIDEVKGEGKYKRK